MKVNKVLEVMSVIDERKTPSDMHEEYVYYSDSNEEFLHVGDMDMIHFMRVAFKHIPKDLMHVNCDTIDSKGYRR
jgi:hypothetical protein